MGFDYIWLSNGFGFGTETWKITGAVYDGKLFFPKRSKLARRKYRNFGDFSANTVIIPSKPEEQTSLSVLIIPMMRSIIK